MSFFLLAVTFVFIFLVGGGVFLNTLRKFLGDRELRRGFECGFDGKRIRRTPFSLRFFLILVLFLIFDLEVVLILQFPFLKLGGFGHFFLSLKSVLVILLLGTLEEWRCGFLMWACEIKIMVSEVSFVKCSFL